MVNDTIGLDAVNVQQNIRKSTHHYLQRCVEWSLASVLRLTEGERASYVITKAEIGDMFGNTRKLII